MPGIKEVAERKRGERRREAGYRYFVGKKKSTEFEIPEYHPR